MCLVWMHSVLRAFVQGVLLSAEVLSKTENKSMWEMTWNTASWQLQAHHVCSPAYFFIHIKSSITFDIFLGSKKTLGGGLYWSLWNGELLCGGIEFDSCSAVDSGASFQYVRFVFLSIFDMYFDEFSVTLATNFLFTHQLNSVTFLCSQIFVWQLQFGFLNIKCSNDG